MFRFALLLAVTLMGCHPSSEVATPSLPDVPGVSTSIEAIPTNALPTWAAPDHYQLILWIDPDSKHFRGDATVTMRLTEPSNHLWLRARGLEQLHMRVETENGEQLDTEPRTLDQHGLIRLALPKQLAPQRLKVQAHYKVPFHSAPDGIHQRQQDGQTYTRARLENFNISRILPSFDDAQYRVPLTLTLMVPPGMEVAASMQPLKRQHMAGWLHLQFAPIVPTPNYRFAFVVASSRASSLLP